MVWINLKKNNPINFKTLYLRRLLFLLFVLKVQTHVTRRNNNFYILGLVVPVTNSIERYLILTNVTVNSQGRNKSRRPVRYPRGICATTLLNKFDCSFNKTRNIYARYKQQTVWISMHFVYDLQTIFKIKVFGLLKFLKQFDLK